MPKLHIIITSTRPGRVGPRVGEWFAQLAAEDGRFDVNVTDLKVLGLPFMDEPNLPQLGQYVHQHTRDWSEMVDDSDAFAFVMPEYNHGFNAPLKNALDYLCNEWAHKPVGFVSYGGVAAGTRAVEMAKQVATALRMAPAVEAVTIPFIQEFLDETGEFHPTDALDQAAVTMLDELEQLQQASRGLRSALATSR
jgi:NAD(P)H-dependent FMN reductase